MAGKLALLTWEIGGGRGHIVHLATVGAALRRRGYELEAHLAHMEHAAELVPLCRSVHEASRLPYRKPSLEHPRPSSRYGDWLGMHHFDEAASVRNQIEIWRRLFAERQPAVVVTEQSPAAMLAARSLGLPLVQVGVPTTAPPPTIAKFPPYLDDDPMAAVYDEAAILSAVNQAIAGLPIPPLAYLAEVYLGDDQVVATIGLLDRYAPWRERAVIPPVVGGFEEPGERRREEVFLYLSTFDRFDPVILAAVATLDLPARAVIAGSPRYSTAVAAMRRTIVEEKPLPPAEIARRSRVLVHAGNHGVTCLGLRAGIPQVMIARQREHVFNGRQVAAAGAGLVIEPDRWTVPNIRAAIAEAWSSQAMAERASDLAKELAPAFLGDPGELSADRIEAAIALH